ncbi:MAG: hypothetical protein LBU07_06645 [Coriobacteriales bacterium]|jgi:hypothetical protein|nr:hypothetical protein [Coriobacteriales bacterium]
MAQADEFSYLLAKTAWMSAGKYLLLVKNLIEKYDAMTTGNLDDMMNEGRYKDYVEAHGAPPAGTSDARSLIPFFYTIYNSIEQFMLAYYYAGFPDDRLDFVPSFVKLQAKFDKFNLAKDATVTAYIHKYADYDRLPALLKGLLDASGHDQNYIKTTRRALENNSLFKVLDEYQPYYFDADAGRQFFGEVYDDAIAMLEKVNRLVEDVNDDGVAGSLVTGLRVR